MSEDFSVKYTTARDRLRRLLSDLLWHERRELERVAGNRYTARILELKRLGYTIEDCEAASGHGKNYRLVSLLCGLPQAKKVKAFIEEVDAEQLLAGYVSDRARAAISEALGSFRANKHKL